MLPGGDRAEASATAMRVLQAVSALALPHEASLTRPYVTVSIGATTVEPGGDYSHERAVRLADLALYPAKARGRDGWAFHEAGGAADDSEAALLKTAS